ncbi:hypothetical protein BD626DRAFT_278474 [Schizophyllum amplum]|uniref:Uncharacterized protein n=1 Tax=Schizophyllum amplum TaxID=97359 RepID=A0A550BTE0_9AGAR|nr:hypothetical protein BD626DRAFT_278474 [Auriculariopsis ampla]
MIGVQCSDKIVLFLLTPMSDNIRDRLRRRVSAPTADSLQSTPPALARGRTNRGARGGRRGRGGRGAGSARGRGFGNDVLEPTGEEEGALRLQLGANTTSPHGASLATAPPLIPGASGLVEVPSFEPPSPDLRRTLLALEDQYIDYHVPAPGPVEPFRHDGLPLPTVHVAESPLTTLASSPLQDVDLADVELEEPRLPSCSLTLVIWLRAHVAQAAARTGVQAPRPNPHLLVLYTDVPGLRACQVYRLTGQLFNHLNSPPTVEGVLQVLLNHPRGPQLTSKLATTSEAGVQAYVVMANDASTFTHPTSSFCSGLRTVNTLEGCLSAIDDAQQTPLLPMVRSTFSAALLDRFGCGEGTVSMLLILPQIVAETLLRVSGSTLPNARISLTFTPTNAAVLSPPPSSQLVIPPGGFQITPEAPVACNPPLSPLQYLCHCFPLHVAELAHLDGDPRFGAHGHTKAYSVYRRHTIIADVGATLGLPLGGARASGASEAATVSVSLSGRTTNISFNNVLSFAGRAAGSYRNHKVLMQNLHAHLQSTSDDSIAAFHLRSVNLDSATPAQVQAALSWSLPALRARLATLAT